MHARNDIAIPGPAFVDALRRILPREAKRDPGYVILRPGEAGTLTLEGFYAAASVPADGAWADAVHAPGPVLRTFVTDQPPATVRLVFHDRMLSINGTTVTAAVVADDDMPHPPADQPRNRSAPRATRLRRR